MAPVQNGVCAKSLLKKKKKKRNGMGGVAVDRWRAGNEMETSRSMKRRGGRVETRRRRGQKQEERKRMRGNKKNSPSAVFHQGRNYTFAKVFS